MLMTMDCSYNINLGGQNVKQLTEFKKKNFQECVIAGYYRYKKKKIYSSSV